MQIMCILISIVMIAAFASLIREAGSLIQLAVNSVSDDVVTFVIGIFTVSFLFPLSIARGGRV